MASPSHGLPGLGTASAVPKPVLSLAGAGVDLAIQPGPIVGLRIGHAALPIIFELPLRSADIDALRLTLAEVSRQLEALENGGNDGA